MSKLKSIALLAYVALSSSNQNMRAFDEGLDKRKEAKKIIPKGCKEYVFEESFGTLKVIASNEKTALKKYDKWCKENIIKDY